MKKLNNKGFSLVELIIVIAIMAILVGVVGTQVIPYLEQSRQGKDIQVFSSWNTSAMSAYSSAAAKVDAGAAYKILITDGSVVCSGAPYDASGAIGTYSNTYKGASDILDQFEALTNLAAGTGYDFDNKMESKAGKEVKSVVIVIEKDGNITVKICSDAAGATEKDEFKGAVENK